MESSEPRPAAPTTDGRRPRWRVVFAAFAATAHGPGVHYIYGVFQAALLDARFSTSRALLGGAGGLSTCLMLLGARPAGTLQAAHGAGLVVGGGAAIAVVGLLLCAAAMELWMLYVGFGVLVGVGHALQFAPCPVAVAEAFEGSDRAAVASGVATSGAGAGTAALGATVAAVVAWRTWRVAFVVVAASTVLFVAPAAAVFRHADRWRREADKATSLTASRRLRHLCATAFCYGLGWEVPFVHLVSYAEDAGHTPSRAAGVVVAVGVGGSAGRILSARCADAVGAPRVFSALILATCAADLVLPWTIRHASALYVYGAVAGTTAGGLIALTTPMARTCLADTAGLPQASGAVYSSMAPGVVAGPVLVGLIRDRVGSYAWGFRGAAGCWAVAFALCLTLPRRRPGVS
jgi:predicted MFS family arabinose efflux permease